MEFLRLSLRRHSAGKPVVAWRNAGYPFRILWCRVGPHRLLIFIIFLSASKQGRYIRYWAEGEARSWTAETHNEIYQWSQEDRKCENALPSICLLGFRGDFFCSLYQPPFGKWARAPPRHPPSPPPSSPPSREETRPNLRERWKLSLLFRGILDVKIKFICYGNETHFVWKKKNFKSWLSKSNEHQRGGKLQQLKERLPQTWNKTCQHSLIIVWELILRSSGTVAQTLLAVRCYWV